MQFSLSAVSAPRCRTAPLLALIAILCAFASPSHSQDVLTFHNNNSRTGLNSGETILTPRT